MKEATATTTISTTAECPYCEYFFYLEDDMDIVFEESEQFGCDNFNQIVKCTECGKQFKITNIEV